MMELAQAIAHFVRQADTEKALAIRVERVQRSNAQVIITAKEDVQCIPVEWFKGGARVGSRRFYRDEVTKQFNISVIVEYVAELLLERKKNRERLKNEQQMILAFKFFQDLVRGNKKISVAYSQWDNGCPFSVTYRTSNMDALMPLLDQLQEFYDGVEPIEPFNANPAKRTFVCSALGSRALDTRCIARLPDITSENFEQIMQLAVEDSIFIDDFGTVTRAS